MSATGVTPDIAAKGGAAGPVSWSEYVARDYVFADFAPGSRVLDIGFGCGRQMQGVQRAGAHAFGVEYDHQLAVRAQAAGLAVCRASSEQLPIGTGAVDGVICKVVILLTDEARSVAEIGRVLRPGGVAHLVFHGVGYSMRYLVHGGWRQRVYAARTILNTWVYRRTGRRLPGFWGDTLYQSTRRLHRYYRRAGLELTYVHPSPTYAAAPVFIYHTLRKVRT
jgi:SAM-dependent methyltransferase